MKERNYGIELLRLVLMFMVCMLHTLGQGGLLYNAVPGSITAGYYWFLEILSYCAVDGFALISGYTATGKPKNYSKIVDMWFQVFFYSFIVSLLLNVSGSVTTVSSAQLLMFATPLLSRSYWFFTAYFAMFFLSPIIDNFVFSIEKKTAEYTFIGMVLLFSVITLISDGDPFILSGGYSAIWITVIYLIGALAKKIELFETKKTRLLIALWAALIIFTWAMRIFAGIGGFVSYVSPTILFSALLMLIIFSRLKLSGKILRHIAPLAFGIYLLQNNAMIWEFVIKNRFIFILDQDPVLKLLLPWGIALCIFAIGLAVEFLRSKLAQLIRLHTLSEKIVLLISRAFGLASKLLR